MGHSRPLGSGFSLLKPMPTTLPLSDHLTASHFWIMVKHILLFPAKLRRNSSFADYFQLSDNSLISAMLFRKNRIFHTTIQRGGGRIDAYLQTTVFCKPLFILVLPVKLTTMKMATRTGLTRSDKLLVWRTGGSATGRGGPSSTTDSGWINIVIQLLKALD